MPNAAKSPVAAARAAAAAALEIKTAFRLAARHAHQGRIELTLWESGSYGARAYLATHRVGLAVGAAVATMAAEGTVWSGSLTLPDIDRLRQAIASTPIAASTGGHKTPQEALLALITALTALGPTDRHVEAEKQWQQAQARMAAPRRRA